MIKILLITQSKLTGLNYHRQLVPHDNLLRNYPNDYDVTLCVDIDKLPDEEIKKHQIVTFLRLVHEKFRSEEIIKRCQALGCKVIIDIDDYWFLHPTHELYHTYQKHKVAEQTISGLRIADCITTTTEHFAKKIMEQNKNVLVLQNSIEPTEPQYQHKPTESERIRFGWIGGVYHAPDIRLMYNGFKEVWKGCRSDKFQLCLGGYGNNPSYNFLEKVFTDNYKYPKDFGNNYQKYLAKQTPEGNEIADKQPYKRLWAKEVNKYCEMYNEIDVALVPLNVNGFNSYKSQIKIIEAGWFKKAAIVSNVLPYNIDCNKHNSILITPDKRGAGWGVSIKSLLHNPERIKEYAEALHQTVLARYLMDDVNKIRHQLYQRICE